MIDNYDDEAASPAGSLCLVDGLASHAFDEAETLPSSQPTENTR